MAELDYMKKFQKELKTMFRSEDKDFNWGIYRIMNQKNEEITKYIEDELPKIVEEKLSKLKGDFSQTIDEELKKLEKTLRDADVDPNTSPKYKELIYQKEKGVSLKEFEEQTYNNLLDFFSRYYQDGDFINQFYFKDDTYLIPYDGAEISFHWATKDMYYVKSSDQYQRFSFLTKDEKKNVLLKLVSREEEKNNQKGRDKYFIFDSLEGNDNELVCNIALASSDDEIKDLGKNKTERQEKLNEEIVEKIKDELGDHVNGIDILKNITKFQKRYVEDFFIHKDLKGFLESQMGFYINQEILNIDSLIDESGNFNEDLKIVAKVFKDICKNIIEKLALLEDLKKKIWEKKKFIIETNYIVTLDKIQEYCGNDYLDNIINEILSNEKQIKEWYDLFGFKIENKKDLIVTNTLQGVKYKKLPIDTKNFDDEYKWNLLKHIKNIDERLNGMLINSENWQCLNLIKQKYNNKVNCCLIDPPYNTGSDEFIYKDNYRHSSWLTMIENRISMFNSFLKENGIFYSHINDNEINNIKSILNNEFGEDNFVAQLIWENREGGGSSDSKHFKIKHEYIISFAKNKNELTINGTEIEDKDRYALEDMHVETRGRYQLVKLNSASIQYSSSLDYPINAPDGSKIYPSYGTKRACWRWSKNKLKWGIENDFVVIKKDSQDNWAVYTKQYLNVDNEGKNIERTKRPIGVIEKYSSTMANKDMFNLFNKKVFDYSKPYKLLYEIFKYSTNKQDIIIDFFAGSGSAAHALINLEKDNECKRKIILIEMANYFDDVMIPRIKKILYSLSWKNGNPETMNSIGGFFKYQNIEQYEDALENIVLKQSTLEMFNENLDILLRYYLDDGIDTNKSKNFLGVDTEKEFLDLRINVLNKDRTTRQQKVDLIETFNYLIGLVIDQMKKQDEYYIITGKIGEDKTIVFWRDPKKITDKEADKDFMNKFIQEDSYKHVFVNSDCNIKNYKNIYDEMRKRLW